jgi:tripartite motif-containing protein 2/3
MDIGEKQIEMMQHIDNDAKMKANELRGSAKGIEHLSSRLQVQYHKAQNDINDTYNYFKIFSKNSQPRYNLSMFS